jgi:CheY-like chemotaxis protein
MTNERTRTSPAAGHFTPGAAREAQAYSELLSKGAEEIQDHLSLVARVQVQIGRLLETSIGELERARRLETLTCLIAGNDPGGGGDTAASDEVTEERPGAYLDREIKTLRKMQKLLGLKARTGEEEAPAAGAPDLAVGEDADGGEEEAPRKVLLIFHDTATHRLLRYFLEKEDWAVVACSNGPDGLKRVVTERPDIVLLDILLPGMDGYQVLARLKKEARTAAIPVFVLSVLAQEADIVKAIDAGAADYFVKPFSPPVIIAKIRRTLKAHHA